MKEFLESFQLLTSAEIDEVIQMATPKTLKKGDYWIKEGSVTKGVAFISSGLLRSFYYSSSGEEVTYCLSFENSFVTAYSSLITQAPTDENIRALTDVELLMLTREQLEKLENSSINWVKLFKLFAEMEYVKMEKRMFLLQRESAETRYEDLVQNHPEFLQHIPLNYLASYLGITQRHLSRIRANISN